MLYIAIGYDIVDIDAMNILGVSWTVTRDGLRCPCTFSPHNPLSLMNVKIMTAL